MQKISERILEQFKPRKEIGLDGHTNIEIRR